MFIVENSVCDDYYFNDLCGSECSLHEVLNHLWSVINKKKKMKNLFSLINQGEILLSGR